MRGKNASASLKRCGPSSSSAATSKVATSNQLALIGKRWNRHSHGRPARDVEGKAWEWAAGIVVENAVRAGDRTPIQQEEIRAKRARDTLAEERKGNAVPEFSEAILKRRRSDTGCEDRSTQLWPDEQPPHYQHWLLGLLIQPECPITPERLVSMISPRTAKKIRRLPIPGQSELQVLQVRL